MSSHNDHDNHSTEPKEVSFRTPLILGLVTTLIILLAVSTCDNKPHSAGGEHHEATEAHAHDADGHEGHDHDAHDAAPTEEHASH